MDQIVTNKNEEAKKMEQETTQKTEEEKSINLNDLEKDVMKELNSGAIWIKTKEVAKTTGKVALMLLVAFTAIAALGAGTAYANKSLNKE